MIIKVDSGCFGCGQDNPIGLKLKFMEEGDEFWAEYMPREVYQGYPGILHGGIISTLLDEVMVNQMLYRGISTVTVELNVRFKKPVPIGRKLRVTSRIRNESRLVFEMESRLEVDGEVHAEGRAKLMKPKK